MDQIHRVRELFYEQGKNLTEIAEIVGCDWRTAIRGNHIHRHRSDTPRPGDADTFRRRIGGTSSVMTEDVCMVQNHF